MKFIIKTLHRIRCGILIRTIKPKSIEVVDINSLSLGHSTDHPRTKKRIERLVGSGILSKGFLSHEDISSVMPSDRMIMVRHGEVVNGNGRVASLKACGYKGTIEVVIL